jgi:GTP-binding protein
VKPNQQVTIIDSEGKTRNGKVGKVLTHLGLERIESDWLKRATSSRSPVWAS